MFIEINQVIARKHIKLKNYKLRIKINQIASKAQKIEKYEENEIKICKNIGKSINTINIKQNSKRSRC